MREQAAPRSPAGHIVVMRGARESFGTACLLEVSLLRGLLSTGGEFRQIPTRRRVTSRSSRPAAAGGLGRLGWLQLDSKKWVGPRMASTKLEITGTQIERMQVSVSLEPQCVRVAMRCSDRYEPLLCQG